MTNLARFFREAIQGFTRNASTAIGSIVTIFLSLLIIGLFMAAGSMLDSLMSSVENEVSITCYIKDDASQTNYNAMMDKIRKMDSVATVSFTTKDQAMENFKKSNSSNPDIIDGLDGNNPLPASINVELSDSQKVTEVANKIANDSDFKKICDNESDPSESVKYGQGTVERLFQITNYIRIAGIVVIAILVFIALVFINNTIRLAILARRKEIAIMRLVGASNGYIRGPFIMEGALHAIIGSGLAILVIELLRRFAVPQLQNMIKFLNFSVDGSVYGVIYIALVVFGLIIGIIGSLLAMRKYLRV
ncbi:MAG: permease-like cell division protein FtsX [Phoenicibacter congonensis]|uniref:Cell division protein FtsX n=1 Tax=Phoenicibacter congonensis TaxID=1944646 RepID=A0AA43U957_9ACTN|nr:permease-like cell division protein FtsX [Phoenicibacter congonensis]